MFKLLIIADDFTGALDSGVHFASRGAVTRVATDSSYDFSGTGSDVQVLVMDAETRHISAKEAYGVVFGVVRRALDAGFTHIYKKTDSALRGNIGAELSAVMDAAGSDVIDFLPALPRMNRVTRGGVQYIDGLPAAESVFSRDPFEPVKHSSIAEIIAEESDVPVIVHDVRGGVSSQRGIHVYDAESDDDLACAAEAIGRERLRLSAGCAGFASVLSDALGLDGSAPDMPNTPDSLFIVCGSVNPVTIDQMRTANKCGFRHFHLAPEQKLEAEWTAGDECGALVDELLCAAREAKRVILDANDPDGCAPTDRYADGHGLTTDDMRVRIAANLGAIMRRLLDGGLDATMLCTGGDTLLAAMRTLGVSELTPLREAAPGAVMSCFSRSGKSYNVISKSGGFGEPDLFCRLAETFGA